MHVLVKINYNLNLFRKKKKLALFLKLFYEHIIFIPTSMPTEISAGENVNFSNLTNTYPQNEPHISVICDQNITYHSN